MPKCAECGTETELHELDIPICPDCINARERDGPPVQDLADAFLAAREHYRKRMAVVEERQGLPSEAEETEAQTAKENT